MSDNIRQESGSYKAGRGFARLLRGIFGRKKLRQARDSVRVLKDEYQKGKEGEPEPQPKRIPHREVDPPTSR